MNSYFAKQPIINLKGETYGYELLYRNAPTIQTYNANDGDKSTADIINNVFFGPECSELLNGKKAFLNFTENLLLAKTALLLPKDEVVIEILESVNLTPKILNCCRELVDRGYTLAADDYILTPDTMPLMEYCQIIKIDFRVGKTDIENTAAEARRRNKILLAEKIESTEEEEYAKSLGCTLMQGFFFAKPLIMQGTSYNPMAVTFSKLIGMLKDVEPGEIDVDELSYTISLDPFMTAKMLRLVNSVRSDMSSQISSVKQAILMLGTKKLKEWVYMVGLQSLATGGPDEIVRVALFRAIFSQTVSIMIFDSFASDEEMYLMGLMSVVVNLDDTETMNAMKLSDNIIAGLSSREGIYGDTFNFVLDFEQANWSGVDTFVEKYKLDGNELLKKYIECMNNVESMCNLAM